MNFKLNNKHSIAIPFYHLARSVYFGVYLGELNLQEKENGLRQTLCRALQKRTFSFQANIGTLSCNSKKSIQPFPHLNWWRQILS